MSATAAADLHLVPPPRAPLVHIGQGPNPFRWRHPLPLDRSVHPRAGSRFDAPQGEYMTLYCATDRYGALLEKLDDLRRKPGLAAQVAAATDDDADAAYDRVPGDTRFPSDVFQSLQVGLVRVDREARFVDVDDPQTHAGLEKYGGAPLLSELGVRRIDRGTFLTPDRGLTRRAAHELHELVGEHAAGLRYTSALDRGVECWAVWEHARPLLQPPDIEPIDASSPDFSRVVNRLGFDPL